MKRLLRFKFYPRSGLNVRAGIIHGESFAELIPQVKEIMYSESMPLWRILCIQGRLQ